MTVVIISHYTSYIITQFRHFIAWQLKTNILLILSTLPRNSYQAHLCDCDLTTCRNNGTRSSLHVSVS